MTEAGAIPSVIFGVEIRKCHPYLGRINGEDFKTYKLQFSHFLLFYIEVEVNNRKLVLKRENEAGMTKRSGSKRKRLLCFFCILAVLGLHSSAQAPLVREVCGLRIVGQGLSLPHQGWNLYPLPWKVDSLPLEYQRSPRKSVP